MRALFLVAVLATACTPDLVPGSYFCGPEQLCPEGQKCNGADNLCVLPSAAEPFACSESTELEPNNAFAMAQPVLVGAACASLPAEARGCTSATDGQDFFGFSVPAQCTTVSASARLTFPVAFAPLAVTLVDGTNTVAVGVPCESDEPDDGETKLCFDGTVRASGNYAVVVSATGQDTCDGACAYNRYQLTVQLKASAAR